jgi:hypothetical protein
MLTVPAIIVRLLLFLRMQDNFLIELGAESSASSQRKTTRDESVSADRIVTGTTNLPVCVLLGRTENQSAIDRTISTKMREPILSVLDMSVVDITGTM